MSWRATAWVNQIKGITRSEKLLMFVLSDRYNEDEGCARPSIPKIAVEALMSPRTVSRVLDRLQKKGILEVVERPGKVSLYKFPTVPTTAVLSVPSKLRDDKICLPESNTHDKKALDPCHLGGIRTDRTDLMMNRFDDENRIDTTQDILPWLKRRWEERQSTLSKGLRKKFNLGPYPEQFERQEESLGKLEYRKLFIEYLSDFNQGMIDFAKKASPYCSGRRIKDDRVLKYAGEEAGTIDEKAWGLDDDARLDKLCKEMGH